MYTQNNDSLINFFKKYNLQKHIESLEEDPSHLSILFVRYDEYQTYYPSFVNTAQLPVIKEKDDTIITNMIRDLAQVLSHNTTIKSFDFSVDSTKKPELAAIAELFETLKNNKSITSFKNSIQCEFEGEKFADIFKTNTTITSLYFYADQAYASAVFKLFEALKTSTSITSFSICGNGVTAEELADFVKTSKSLTHLHVMSSVMKNDESITQFSQALAKNTTLTSLEFASSSYITKFGAEKFTEGLRVNTGLKHLVITGRGIEEGADLVLMKGIATVVSEKSLNSLKFLSRVVNEIPDIFFESLENNTTLDSITLDIGEVKQIAGVIKRNKTLTSIDFKGVAQLKAHELQEIVNALKENTNLSAFYMPPRLYIMTENESTHVDNLVDFLSTNDNLLYFTNNFTISHFPQANKWLNGEINKRLNHNNLKFDKFAEFLASNSLITNEKNIVAKINTENLKFLNFTYTKFLNYYKQTNKVILDKLLQKYCPQEKASELSASIINQMDEFRKIHPFAAAGVCKKITVTDEPLESTNIENLSLELIYRIASFLKFEEWGISQVKANNTATNLLTDQPTQVENLGESQVVAEELS